jgi:hypothetical protein
MDTVFKTPFPIEWKDPLDLCGRFVQDLVKEHRDLKQHRDFVMEMVRKYGADWVWENRSRLVALMVFLSASMRN